MSRILLVFLIFFGIIPNASRASGSSGYQQIISFSAGPFSPASASIAKGPYTFNYDSEATRSILIEAGAATQLFWFGGSFYLNANLAFTRFSGTFTSDAVTSVPNIYQNNALGLSVNLFGLDTRITHAWDWFPISWIVPFLEVGYLYTLYSQFGSSDYDSVQGGVGNSVAAAGFRFCLNPAASVRTEDTQSYFSIPIFLSLKWNRIFPNGQSLDLANSNFLFSASFGL